MTLKRGSTQQNEHSTYHHPYEVNGGEENIGAPDGHRDFGPAYRTGGDLPTFPHQNHHQDQQPVGNLIGHFPDVLEPHHAYPVAGVDGVVEELQQNEHGLQYKGQREDLDEEVGLLVADLDADAAMKKKVDDNQNDVNKTEKQLKSQRPLEVIRKLAGIPVCLVGAVIDYADAVLHPQLVGIAPSAVLLRRGVSGAGHQKQVVELRGWSGRNVKREVLIWNHVELSRLVADFVVPVWMVARDVPEVVLGAVDGTAGIAQ